MDFLGLRRNGSSPQIINQAQDSPEQASRHGNLGQLERDVPPMSEDLGSNLDQLLANSASVGLWHFVDLAPKAAIEFEPDIRKLCANGRFVRVAAVGYNRSE